MAAEEWVETLGALLDFIVSLAILTGIFYIAGRAVVGKKRALLSDAFVISLLGTIVASIFAVFIRSAWIGLILSLVIWLLLIRHYYETGWLGALAVAVMAVIIYIAILFLLATLLAIPFLLVGG